MPHVMTVRRPTSTVGGGHGRTRPAKRVVAVGMTAVCGRQLRKGLLWVEGSSPPCTCVPSRTRHAGQPVGCSLLVRVIVAGLSSTQSCDLVAASQASCRPLLLGADAIPPVYVWCFVHVAGMACRARRLTSLLHSLLGGRYAARMQASSPARIALIDTMRPCCCVITLSAASFHAARVPCHVVGGCLWWWCWSVRGCECAPFSCLNVSRACDPVGSHPQ